MIRQSGPAAEGRADGQPGLPGRPPGPLPRRDRPRPVHDGLPRLRRPAYLPESDARIAAAGVHWPHNPTCELEVDGGIDPGTTPPAVAAGATVLVAGTAIFGATDGPAAATRRLAQLVRIDAETVGEVTWGFPRDALGWIGTIDLKGPVRVFSFQDDSSTAAPSTPVAVVCPRRGRPAPSPTSAPPPIQAGSQTIRDLAAISQEFEHTGASDPGRHGGRQCRRRNRFPCTSR